MSTFVGGFRKENPMSKSETLVRIPVGHICIEESEFLNMHKQLIHLGTELRLRTSECRSLDGEVAGLKKQLAEADKKIEELQRDFETRSNAMVFWNKEYEKLKKQLLEITNGGSGNAETKET
jgi:chromosome segregation ATPase